MSKYPSLTGGDAVSNGKLYRARKNSILKFREVIGRAKTKIFFFLSRDCISETRPRRATDRQNWA
jgi:hypothetical protein